MKVNIRWSFYLTVILFNELIVFVLKLSDFVGRIVIGRVVVGPLVVVDGQRSVSKVLEGAIGVCQLPEQLLLVVLKTLDAALVRAFGEAVQLVVRFRVADDGGGWNLE
jgi:hypothetical protein